MRKWIRQLDQILRGDATRLTLLRDGRIEMPVGGLVVVVTALAAFYGLCMGAFAVLRRAQWQDGISEDAAMQMVASAVKLPILFFLTLLVTFPSLYVFNALVGSRLSIVSVARLLVAMLGVMMAVLASLGPIVVFFAVSTTSYPFMKLLNVVMATVAGVLGLAFLLRTLHRLVMMQYMADFPPIGAGDEDGDYAADVSDHEDATSALDPVEAPTGRKATAVFQIWVVVFAMVGAQMSWVLRPFIGNPNMDFEWLRRRESNFFLDVMRAIGDLFGA